MRGYWGRWGLGISGREHSPQRALRGTEELRRLDALYSEGITLRQCGYGFDFYQEFGAEECGDLNGCA